MTWASRVCGVRCKEQSATPARRSTVPSMTPAPAVKHYDALPSMLQFFFRNQQTIEAHLQLLQLSPEPSHLQMHDHSKKFTIGKKKEPHTSASAAVSWRFIGCDATTRSSCACIACNSIINHATIASHGTGSVSFTCRLACSFSVFFPAAVAASSTCDQM